MLSDPRVFFAAERTLLAWVRTGLTVMAFGFVVARFGLFLRLLAAQHVETSGSALAQGPFEVSSILGIALVLVGSACMIVGAVQHRSYVRTLPPADVPRTHGAIYPVSLSIFLAIVGVVLAVYLAI
jgi:putative membrane protein